MTQTVMHDYARRGAAATCCGRLSHELPLGDGRTSDTAHITCDGTFTPAVFAHEVYPHPSDDPEEAPPLADAVRYHAARALALYSDDIDHPLWGDRLFLALAERQTAWHVAALAKGLAGHEALSWVHAYSADETNELLHDLCVEFKVELHRIKSYPLREMDAEPAQPPAAEIGNTVRRLVGG